MKSKYLFANELNSRNVVALPNVVWALDLTKVPVKVLDKPEVVFKLLLVLDFAGRSIIGWHLFTIKSKDSSESGKCVRAKYVVRLLKQLVDARLNKQKDELLIHCGRGAEFVSAQYNSFIKENSYIIGSMSRIATPRDNGIMEKVFRTVKTQLFNFKGWPNSFDSLHHLNKYLAERIDYYNNEHKSASNLGFSRTELDKILEETEINPPEVLLHWNQKKDAAHHEIVAFRKDALSEAQNKAVTPERLTKSILNTEVQTTLFRGEMRDAQANLLSKIEDLQEELSNIRESLNKGKSRKLRKSLPLRQPATNTIYSYLLGLKKPPNYHYFVWSRNRIAVALLFHLGSRANELTPITYKMLKEGMQQGFIQVFQPKVNTYKFVVFTEALKNDLKGPLQVDLATVFNSDQDVLGRSYRDPNRKLTPKKWVKTLNAFISLAKDYAGAQHISSHSFRINYVTSLLRTVPIQQVMVIVGHKNVNTTQRYDRFPMQPDVLAQKIEGALLNKE
jgi:site-specific recombinase XerD